ncbi:MAG: hypothetical protein V3T31_03535, partial [candidate division Zixibacteria bacterium]
KIAARYAVSCAFPDPMGYSTKDSSGMTVILGQQPSSESLTPGRQLPHLPGVTKAQIGRELDINPNMITGWQREL